jgi:hypothetical protein
VIKRALFDIVLFISIFIFPWWVSIFFIILGVFIFSRYYEFIVAFVIIFSVYSIPNDRIIYSPALFSLFVIIFYVFIQYFKNNIILYKK